MVRAAKFEWNEANQITSRGTASRRGRSSKRLPTIRSWFCPHKNAAEKNECCAQGYTMRHGRIGVITAHTAKRKLREKL